MDLFKFTHRKRFLFIIDTIIMVGVALLVWLVCLVSGVEDNIDMGKKVIAVAITFVLCMATRVFVGAYNNVWRYANYGVFLKIIISDMFGGIIAVGINYYSSFSHMSVWRNILVVSLFDIATLSSRFFYQMIYAHRGREVRKNMTNAAIVGAGTVGCILFDELSVDPKNKYKPLIFIDADKEKKGSKLRGIRVFSADDNIKELLADLGIKVVFIAIPRLEGRATKSMYDFYTSAGCKVMLYDFPLTDNLEVTDKEVSAKRVIHELNIEDLLFREPIKINDEFVEKYYSGKTVLVTGGGGSIGSEICRQIAKRKPKKLIIFDIYENNAYAIEQELKRHYKEALDLSVEIGSVRDAARLDAVFAYYKPNVVFHAAAHKHVPLMEHSACEAIKNNCLGTYNTANAAEKYGVEKFVLISTDKAVNPTNVMGASKRMCEMVVQCRRESKTIFAAVRFGNVLGSNGSVIPLFKKQIASGGPVTITDKRIIRYFMTIPEASQLVMQAGAMANKGDLFVLDMGKPVKILELAENMIRLSGFEPYRDIDIKEIGLRPGEKLYEELLIKNESVQRTENEKIFIENDKPFTREQIEEKLNVLRNAIDESKAKIAPGTIKAALKSVVPTFVEPEEINKNASASDEMKLVEENKEAVLV